MNFKIGDKVRRKKSAQNSNTWLYGDDIKIVIGFTTGGYLKFKGECTTWDSEYFEFAEEEKMAKAYYVIDVNENTIDEIFTTFDEAKTFCKNRSRKDYYEILEVTKRWKMSQTYVETSVYPES